MVDLLNYRVHASVEAISCNVCGCYGDYCDFFDIKSEEGREILKEFGWDLSKSSHLGHVLMFYSNAICPDCGNFSNFNFFCNSSECSLEKIASSAEEECFEFFARN